MVRTRYLIPLFIVLNLFLCGPLSAEVFKLKSGETVEGNVLIDDAQSIFLEKASGEITQIHRHELEGAPDPEPVEVEEEDPSSSDGLIRRPPAKRHPNKIYLYGRVTQKYGEPLEHVQVLALNAKGQQISADWTREDGSYMMDMTKIGLQGDPVTAIKAEWKAGGSELTEDIRFTRDLEHSMMFPTEGLFSISGRVIDPDGKPAPQAHVTFYGEEGPGVVTDVADGEGRFSVVLAIKITTITVSFSEASGHTNAKSFPGPYLGAQILELRLDPLQTDDFIPGTVIEVGDEPGEVLVHTPGRSARRGG